MDTDSYRWIAYKNKGKDVYVHIHRGASLKHYATFKVRKLESFFYKINAFLQKTITCIRLQAEQILYIIIYNFFQLWTSLSRLFFYVIFKSCIFLWWKTFETIFAAFFSQYVQLKSSFSGENNVSGEIWDML